MNKPYVHSSSCQSSLQRQRISIYSRPFLHAGVLSLLCIPLQAQSPLDPTRSLPPQSLTAPSATVHPEQYIWISPQDATSDLHRPDPKPSPVAFRRTFTLAAIPPEATLYVAQSGSTDISLNGTLLRSYKAGGQNVPGLMVSAVDVHSALRMGENLLTIRVLAGTGSRHTTSNPLSTQVTTGHTLLVKLLPAAQGIDAAPLLISDANWEAAPTPIQPEADSSSLSWAKAVSIGSIDSDIAFHQWNADAGLYNWPGYEGLSPFLRRFTLPATRTLRLAPGSSTFQNLDSLLSAQPSKPFTVMRSPAADQEQPPSLMLDFGREVNGRIRLVSASDHPTVVSVAYGESEEEALYRPHLGTPNLYLPAHGTASAPKSAFRYGYLRFPQNVSLASVDLDGITYPVEYRGSFNSSDPLLNRIWETGAYTAHLCMLDGIWDGAKRDRARWMGDLDVSGRTISAVFGDQFLMKETLLKLVRDRLATADINSIHGYTPLWISGIADFYRHNGDRAFLQELHPDLLQLLSVMNAQFDAHGVFTPPHKETVFVDWSDGFHSDTPESRRATQFQFILGYREAAFLLTELGDLPAAARARERLTLLSTAAQNLRSPGNQTYGERWQTNAIAIVSGAAGPNQYAPIWDQVLSHVGTFTPETPSITPYYGYYVLQAMARTGHTVQAVDWIRSFWGGMLAVGATSFWEAYDPRWPKRDFHSAIQADDKVGYYGSLAHAWSSGPTPWLMEHILGIEPTGPGFSTVLLHPDLAGLDWAEGADPTPSGNLAVRLRKIDATTTSIHLELPPNTSATLAIPSATASTHVLLNGQPLCLLPAEATTRTSCSPLHPGTYDLTVHH